MPGEQHGDGVDQDDFERQWEDLDQKVILAQILAELQQIRMVLSDGARATERDDDTDPAYRCKKCDVTVEADARGRHARKSHKAPADMVDDLFEVVE